MEEIKQEDRIIEERKEKLLSFFKTKHLWAYFSAVILAIFSIWLRTRNLPLLRDVTTNGWTLGPDLDPFLFLRWAKHIVENGSIMALDTFRYVPLGFETSKELVLLPYMIAWFHKIALWFGSASVEQSAALFPAFMFGLTVIAFFLLTRKIFINLGENKANIIASISSFFLIVIPSLLPRTIAGIPEKESMGFLFMFLAFYFFLSAWESEGKVSRYFNAIFSAVATALMSLSWGGAAYIFYTISFSILIAFVLGKLDLEKIYLILIWLIGNTIITLLLTERFTLFHNFLASTTHIVILISIIAALLYLYIEGRKPEELIKNSFLGKIPLRINILIALLILGIIFSSIILGPSFLFGKFNEIKSNLVNPITDRLGVTVAENRQPFYQEWVGSFGPVFSGIPLFFWLFFIGSIYLFYNSINFFEKKDRRILTLSYLIFLLSIVFSRYKPDSILNGTNLTSLLIYITGFIVLILFFCYYYYKYEKEGKENLFKNINFGFIILFILFLLSILSARGAVRLIMMLVPPTSIIVSYFAVESFSKARDIKDDIFKVVAWIVVLLILLSALFSAYAFYRESYTQSKVYAPSGYTNQWQKAMSWVRENTPQNAVFGHWWDYGYWIQSIGNRATILDGGNAISYWNHLMGRYALTGRDSFESMEFLCSHNGTHFLIDSTDIGKYGAFSSIGSDKNYDRASSITSFLKNPQQLKETKNGTIYLYSGGISIDSDILYDSNGTKIFLPAGKAGLGGILVELDSSGKIISQPEGVFIYQNQRYDLPLRYAFKNSLIDYNSGVESGIFIMPRLISNQGRVSVDSDGALFYLSNKTVKSQLARLYLYNLEDPYFKLVHTEEDAVALMVRNNGLNETSFIYDEVYPGIRGNSFAGPIKIWEVKCPSNFAPKQEFLSTIYPEEIKNA